MEENETKTPIESVEPIIKNEKKPKKGRGLLIAEIILFINMLLFFGLSLITLLFPFGSVIFIGFYVFGLIMLDIFLVVVTLFLILLSQDFYDFNSTAFGLVDHFNDYLDTVLKVVTVALPILFGLATMIFLANWIIVLIGLIKAKRKAFIPFLVILIIMTLLFVIVAI